MSEPFWRHDGQRLPAADADVITPLRLRVRRAAAATGLLPVVFAAYRVLREWSPALAWRNARWRLTNAPDGLPIPPGDLIFSVAASRNVDWFLRLGRDGADSIRDSLASVGRPLESLDAVLDFGCGCGRVLRHFATSGPRRLCGCDYNSAGIAWVERHLPFAEVRTNELRPPLPYPDATFDAVYALSVFTHLSAELQAAWFAEMHRVLRAGGLLLFSSRGARYLDSLSREERARFDADGFVVRDAQYAGTNICAAWHSERFVARELAGRFRLLRFEPDGARGNLQDLYVVEKVSSG